MHLAIPFSNLGECFLAVGASRGCHERLEAFGQTPTVLLLHDRNGPFHDDLLRKKFLACFCMNALSDGR